MQVVLSAELWDNESSTWSFYIISLSCHFYFTRKSRCGTTLGTSCSKNCLSHRCQVPLSCTAPSGEERGVASDTWEGRNDRWRSGTMVNFLMKFKDLMSPKVASRSDNLNFDYVHKRMHAWLKESPNMAVQMSWILNYESIFEDLDEFVSSAPWI